MAKADEKLKAQIAEKSDREIQEWILFSTAQSEKHLSRISNNVVFFMWVIIVCVIFYVAGTGFAVLALGR